MLEEDKHKGFDKDGHLNENSIAVCAEWLVGGDVKLSPEIKSHLQKCSQCKNDVLEISEYVKPEGREYDTANSKQDMFEESCAGKYSPSIRQVNSSQFWKVAAIFIVLITITSLAVFIKPNKEVVLVNNEQAADTSIQDPSREDTLLKEAEAIKVETIEGDLYAENFVPNSNLEALIGVKYRAGVNPKIKNPVSDTTLLCGGSISFTGSNPDGLILEIQILDNQGRIKEKYSDLKEVSQIIKLNFDPGIYYWKLLGEHNLFQVGKIVLKK